MCGVINRNFIKLNNYNANNANYNGAGAGVSASCYIVNTSIFTNYCNTIIIINNSQSVVNINIINNGDITVISMVDN